MVHSIVSRLIVLGIFLQAASGFGQPEVLILDVHSQSYLPLQHFDEAAERIVFFNVLNDSETLTAYNFLGAHLWTAFGGDLTSYSERGRYIGIKRAFYETDEVDDWRGEGVVLSASSGTPVLSIPELIGSVPMVFGSTERTVFDGSVLYDLRSGDQLVWPEIDGEVIRVLDHEKDVRIVVAESNHFWVPDVWIMKADGKRLSMKTLLNKGQEYFLEFCAFNQHYFAVKMSTGYDATQRLGVGRWAGDTISNYFEVQQEFTRYPLTCAIVIEGSDPKVWVMDRGTGDQTEFSSDGRPKRRVNFVDARWKYDVPDDEYWVPSELIQLKNKVVRVERGKDSQGVRIFDESNSLIGKFPRNPRLMAEMRSKKSRSGVFIGHAHYFVWFHDQSGRVRVYRGDLP